MESQRIPCSLVSLPGPLEQRPESLNRVGVDHALKVGFAVVDDLPRNEAFDRVVSPVFVAHRQGAVGIDVAGQEFEDVSASHSGATSATTLPSHSTAPITAVLSVPRPLGFGLSLERSFRFLGFPPD